MNDFLSIDLIVELLASYRIKTFINNPENILINDVVLIQDSQPVYKMDLLYVCRASLINEMQGIDSQANFICICDTQIKDEYLTGSKINFILIYEQADLMTLYNIINSYVRKHHSLCRWQIKLTNLLISNKSMQSIIDTASLILGNPIIVQDRSFKLLSYTKTFTVDEWVWHQITNAKFTPYEIIKHIKDGDFTKVYNSHLPVFIPKDEYIPSDTLCCRITVLDKPVGHVSLIGYLKPVNSDDGEFLSVLSNILSQLLQKSDLIQYTEGMIYESFFIDLLDEKITDRFQIKNRLKTLGISFKDGLYLLIIKRIGEAKNRIPMFYIRDLIKDKIIDSKSIIYKDDIVVLINRSKANPLQESCLKSIEDLLKENRLVGGFSRSFQDISKINSYYMQSLKAIELGIHLGDKKTIFFYDDYFVNHAIDITTKSLDYKTLCDPLLMDLLEYDSANNTDFSQSLYAYLSCGSNLVKAANMFNIHRNSMNYRINKTQDLLNIDLGDPEVVFSLYFSYKILIHNKEFEPKFSP